MTVEAVEDAPPLDVVHGRVTAEARDTEVPLDGTDAHVLAALAATSIEPYTEIGSLVRRTEAPSDWVLAKITQLIAWRPAGHPPGVDALRARDPGIARAVLEDRASYSLLEVGAGRPCGDLRAGRDPTRAPSPAGASAMERA
jgi:hypothetical protein